GPGPGGAIRAGAGAAAGRAGAGAAAAAAAGAGVAATGLAGAAADRGAAACAMDGGASGCEPVLRRPDGGEVGGGDPPPTSSAPRSYGALRAWPSMSSVTSASTVPASIAGLPAGRWPSAVTLEFACLLLASTFSALRHCDRLPWLKAVAGRLSRKTQPLP